MLLGQLEARYLGFTKELPESLQQIALSKETYQGDTSQEAFSGLQEMNPIISRIPWLFWEESKKLANEIFLGIAEAGACLALASVLLDHLADKQVPEPGPLILLRQAIYDHALTQYRQIFPSNSNFWVEYDRLSRAYITCIQLEIDNQSKPEHLTSERFKEYAGGKVAPMIITIAALGETLNQPEFLPPVETSMLCTSVAGQIHDDIVDWESDLEERHLTYFLTCLDTDGVFKTGDWPTHKELEEVNNTQWRDVKTFYQALEWYDRALQNCDEINCTGWENYLLHFRALAEKHQQNALAKHLLRVLSSGEK